MGDEGRLLAVDPRVLSSDGTPSLSTRSLEPTPLATHPRRAAGTALLEIRGFLATRGEQHLFGAVDGYDRILQRLTIALGSAATRAVVVRIDSPGGELRGLEACARHVAALGESTGIAVHVHVSGCALGAALLLASALGRAGLYVDRDAGVGALRVVRVRPESALLDPVVLPTSSLATSRLVRTIARARGLPTFDAGLVTSRVHIGYDAVRVGLADGVASLDEVIRLAERGAPSLLR